MNLFTAEQVVIACALRYKQSATYILPSLTPDRFIYNRDGEWGNEHRAIWQRIYDSVVQFHSDPSIAGVHIYQDYLQTLVNDLSEKHGIYEFDSNTLLSFAETVQNAGILYNTSQVAKEYGNTVLSEDMFNRRFNSIQSIDLYVSDLIGKLGINSTNKSGYKHASEVVPDVIERWERQYSGEQTILLPTGWPVLEGAHLFPIGELAVLHGMSNMGKSALLLAILVGTAIGLKVNNVPGCTAFNSLEMSSNTLIARTASMLAGVDHTRLIGGSLPLTPEEFCRLKEWAEFIEFIPFYLDDTSLVTTSFLDYLVTSLHNSIKGPVHMMGADYTELFADDESDNREQNVGKVIRNLFAISHKLNTSVITISQSTYGANPGKTYIAGMNGIRWSRGGTHAADIIVELINYPEMRKKGIPFNPPEDRLDDSSAWLLLEKNRNGDTGDFRIGWQPEYTRFYDFENVKANAGMIVMYDHLKECKKLCEQFKTCVPAVEDTPLGEWK